MTAQPWPMGVRDATGPIDVPHTVEFEIVFAESISGPERWRCHELDRFDAQPHVEMPLRWHTFMVISGEFIDRFGYDEARRFVDAVSASRHDERALLPFADLVTNLRLRFGAKGPIAMAAFLACELAITGRGR